MDAESERAFRDFVTGRSAALQRTAYLLTGDRTEAEDAVQSALIRVYLAWPRIERREAVEAYTRRVLVREVLSWRRRRRVVSLLTASPPEGRSAAADEGVADRDRLRRALLELSPRQRAVIVLRFLDDQSEAQTAAALGITVGAVKTHASRGVARMRDLLETTLEEPR